MVVARVTPLFLFQVGDDSSAQAAAAQWSYVRALSWILQGVREDDRRHGELSIIIVLGKRSEGGEVAA